MTFGEKLSKLRRENHITQEQMAEYLGVSRQAISRWESDRAYPETEKIIRLSEYFHCSLDYFLKEDVEDMQQEMVPENENMQDMDGKAAFAFREKEKRQAGDCGEEESSQTSFLRRFYFERKSKKEINGLPLWHINLGWGRTAKGVFALGITAKGVFTAGIAASGIVSLGLVSAGILSFGVLSLGVLSAGAIALGLIAAGAIAAGVAAFGAIACGLLAVGAFAVGGFSVGAMAMGHYFAMGDWAEAMIAIGKTTANGELVEVTGELSEAERVLVLEALEQNVPKIFHWVIAIIKGWI